MISAPFRVVLSLALLLTLASCGSSPRVRGVPRNLPKIDLHGSAATPVHSMEKEDYPFAPSGEYLTAWASNSGRETSVSDFESWQKSHEGSVSRRNPSPVRKVSSSSSKKKSSSFSKSKGGSSYTIKKGDTLGAIAARNGTTVSKIKAANGMSSDFIREGKSLKIPK